MLPAMAELMSASEGVGFFFEQRGGAHDLSRLAIATLGGHPLRARLAERGARPFWINLRS